MWVGFFEEFERVKLDVCTGEDKHRQVKDNHQTCASLALQHISERPRKGKVIFKGKRNPYRVISSYQMHHHLSNLGVFSRQWQVAFWTCVWAFPRKFKMPNSVGMHKQSWAHGLKWLRGFHAFQVSMCKSECATVWHTSITQVVSTAGSPTPSWGT